MAAKLILSMGGVVLQEYPLNKERITIGRKEHNDIVIDNLAVSGEHAVVVTVKNDSFVEDLGSTNGTVVNGETAKRHLLQNNDMIEIGKYKLKYLNDQPGQATAADFEKTMVLRAPVHAPASIQTKDKAIESTGKMKAMMPPSPVAASTTPPVAAPRQQAAAPPPQAKVAPPAQQAAPAVAMPAAQQAMVQILTGPNAGKELDLVKNLTTLGKPGVQVAVLTRRPHGYFITHVEGESYPVLNGKPLGDQPHQLKEHDIIELAGIKMEFYFKN